MKNKKTTSRPKQQMRTSKSQSKKQVKTANVKPKGKSLVGKTYKVNDNDLPHKNEGSGKIVNIAVLESNGKHIGGVRVTTRNGKNASRFKTKHKLYKGFKTFLEIKFQNGDDMISDDKRLHENPWIYNLTVDNINEVRNKIYYHSRQAVENRKRRDELLSKNKKK